MGGFRERLVPGPGPVIAVLLLLPAVWVILLPLSPIAGLIGAIVVTAVVEALLFLLAPVIVVSDGVLIAGPARIAISLTGDTVQYRKADATHARGPGLDARAFTLFRGWVDPVVRIDLVDPEDPTPYWLVSTRHPERLQEALAAQRNPLDGRRDGTGPVASVEGTDVNTDSARPDDPRGADEA